jgi:drug/metabolite transporter (DMT)-like permease
MNTDVLVRFALPLLFVILYSTGYIASKTGTFYTGPMTFLTMRLIIPIVLLGVIVRVTNAPWPKSIFETFHITVAGILLHVMCFGGALLAFKLGVEAGVVALISGVHPLLVTVLAGLILGERSNLYHQAGLLIGLSGVALVVWHKLSTGIGTEIGFMAAIVALFGLSGNALYQKQFCPSMDLRTGSLIQHIAAAIVVAIPAIFFEGFHVAWSIPLSLALFWSSVVLSLGALMIFFTLIRHGEVSKTQAIFFLMPPTTTMLAWVFFAEQPNSFFIVGLIFTVVGVSMINLSPNANTLTSERK